MPLARIVRAVVVTALAAATMFAAQAQTLVGDEIDAASTSPLIPDTGSGGSSGTDWTRRSSSRAGAATRKTYSSAFVLNVEALHFEVDFISLAGWQEGTVLRLTDFDFLETPYPVNLAGIASVQSNLVGSFTVTNTADSIEVAWAADLQ